MAMSRGKARAMLESPFFRMSGSAVDCALKSFRDALIEDVLAIVVDGKRYPSIGPAADEKKNDVPETLLVLETLSTRLATEVFGVDPYIDNVDLHCHVAAAPVAADAEAAARATLVQATASGWWWSKEDKYRSAVIADVLDIVFRGKRYPPRGGSEEERMPEDAAAPLARYYFEVDAYLMQHHNPKV